MTPSPPTPTLLLTPRHAAAALAIGQRTVERLAQRGEIPVVKIGRSTRFAVADLETWIETRRQTAGGTACRQ